MFNKNTYVCTDILDYRNCLLSVTKSTGKDGPIPEEAISIQMN